MKIFKLDYETSVSPTTKIKMFQKWGARFPHHLLIHYILKLEKNYTYFIPIRSAGPAPVSQFKVVWQNMRAFTRTAGCWLLFRAAVGSQAVPKVYNWCRRLPVAIWYVYFYGSVHMSCRFPVGQRFIVTGKCFFSFFFCIFLHFCNLCRLKLITCEKHSSGCPLPYYPLQGRRIYCYMSVWKKWIHHE